MAQAGRKKSESFITASGGFVRADSPTTRRLIMSIDGLEKRGKDHFALTMPPPVAIISLDQGLDGVVQKFQKTKEIWVAEHRVDIAKLRKLSAAEVAEVASEAWGNILRDYLEALENARSVVVDTGTELWEILRLARFGKTEKIMPRDYGPVNLEFREIIRRAYATKNVNLGLLHKMKDEYIKDTRTGEYKRAGFSDVGFAVQMSVQCWRDDTKTFPDCFNVTVTDSRHNPELNGFNLVGDEATFSNLAMMVFSETSEKDWL